MVRQEIADFDARVEKERARASVKVEAAKTHAEAGKLGGRGNKASSDSTGFNDTPKKPKRDAEYWIARLKRDAATDTHAAALLGSIEAGDIKPYRTKKRPSHC